MRSLIVIVCLFCSSLLKADSDTLRFVFTFEGKEIIPGKNYYWAALDDSIRFDNYKLYISNAEIGSEKNKADTFSKRYHLIDSENPSSFFLTFSQSINSSKIKFTVGIDSLTNVSGVMGGDLDPTMGMYWAWQSGYINFKLEGTSNVCKTRKNLFQFHIGGYQQPYACNRIMEFTLSNKKNYRIEIHIDEFLKPDDLKQSPEIMRPGADAYRLFEQLTSAIYLF